MLILRLWNYIRGYVIILVEGFFPEKFINVCINRGLFLWDIDRKRSCLITLKTGAKAFKQMKSIARKTRCRIKIKAKKGLPFVLFKYKKRKPFAVGCLIFIFMVYFLSSFVWTVEVIGNKEVSSQEIINNLAVSGLKPGLWKPVINEDTVSNNMLIRVQKIAWININISGTRAIVEVAERKMPPKLIEKNVPCNIIAKKNGVITSLAVKEGSPMVKIGDSVKKGDLLAAGIVENKDKSIRFVHAMADVKARTWYEEAVFVPFQKNVQKETGKTANQYQILILNKVIGIGSDKPPFKFYNYKQEIKRITFGKDFVFPFGIIINNYAEKVSQKQVIDIEHAKAEAVKEVWGIIKNKLPENAQIKNKKTYMAKNAKGVRARMLVECIEEIGEQEKITY